MNENQLRAKVINRVKKNTSISPIKGFKIELEPFKITRKGQNYSFLYAWSLDDFYCKSYICSLRNSFEVKRINNYYFQETVSLTGRYFGLFIQSPINIPEFTIRPAYFSDRLTNVFLKFDRKIKNQKEFNSKYILESQADLSDLQTIISKELIEYLINQKNFYLESKNSKIFLKHEKELDIENTIHLLRIGEIIDNTIKRQCNNTSKE
jgi:hypothetical protein